MRPSKLTRTAMKPRRTVPSHLHTTLRCTSLFVFALAVAQFSGLAPAVMDTIAALSAPLAHAADSPPPPEVAMHPNPPPNPTRSSLPLHSQPKSALRHLYVDLDPTATMADFVAAHTANLKPARERPAFQLEMHWTDHNFQDKVCRIHNACLQSDGRLLVHSSMRQHEPHLRQCGVPSLAYMRDDSDYDRTQNSTSHDLFGVTPTRYHIPHFLTDILPMIYASELLRPVFTKADSIKSVCEAPRKRPCSRNSIRGLLNPSLYTVQRVAPMALTSWVPQLAAMVFAGKPHMYFDEQMFDGNPKVCFRSIVAYGRHNYFRRGRQWFGNENPIFSSHGVSRKSAMDTSRAALGRKRKGCKKHVAILNRVGWTTRGNILLGRDIVNVEQVMDQVERRAKRTENQNLDLSVSIEYFENKTFAEQVSVMQRADVLLGVHGAGLGNMLFARQDVPIMEVLPFAYYAGPFKGLANALYLEYSQTIAEPDTENFRDCLQVYADKMEDSDLVRRGMEMWNSALQQRKQGNLNSLQAERITERKLVPVKLCARSQRMQVNAMETGKRLVDMAQKLCQAGKER